MDDLDTLMMPYLASSQSPENIQGNDSLHPRSGITFPDQGLNVESDTFFRKDPNFSLPSTSSNDFIPSFNDLMDIVTPSDFAVPTKPLPESPVVDNKDLLSFSAAIPTFTLLNDSLEHTSVSLSAQLHGNFFLAGTPRIMPSTDDAPSPQQGVELTFYRRNLFQITGSVTLPRSLRYVMTEQGYSIPILGQELTISATESVDGNTVKIICMPLATTLAAESNPVPKETNTDTSNSHGNSPKAEKEPRAIALDAIPGHQQDTDLVTFPIAWKRLQFRVATGNNGRRKELQQHFVVRLKVVATLLNGARVSICEAQSAPIIVRGRSPRNFQSRKDLPLSASTTTSRKRREVGEKRSFAQNSASEPNMAPEQASFLATMPHDSSIDSLSLSGFSQSTRDQRRTHNVPAPINLYILDGGKSDSTNLNKETATLAAQPIDLSNNFIITPASGPPAKVRKLHSCDISRTQPTKTSAMVPLLNTPNTPNAQEPFASTADALYEYFPLPLDEMELPVDAVYRPHVVHHTNNDLYFTAKVEGKGYFVAAKHVVLSTRMRK